MDVQSGSSAGHHAMHKLGQCSWPIWRVDDFTNCFQRDYLKELFPLIAVGLSLLFIIYAAIERHIQQRKTKTYQQLPNRNGNVFGVPGYQPNAEETESDEEDEGLSIGAGRLALAKKSTNTSVAVVDRPKGQYAWVVIEELALLGLIACSTIAFATHAYGKRGQMTALVQAGIWTYIFILATLRLTLSNTKWRIPRLWNHTAMLYTIMWCFAIVSFRSVLIHPRSKTTQVLILTDFALTSLLFGIAITTRKGNKAVVMEWENGIEPSREPLASIFSLATFSWVDNIVWKGYFKTLELSEVWNLAPKDKCEAVLQRYRQLPKTFRLAWHLLYFFRGKLFAQCGYAFFSAWFTFAPTLLLKAILEYIENPGDTPRNVVWLYVIMLSFSDIIRSLLDGQALWTGRKVCIQLRAIIIGEIYAKALRRKAAASGETVLGDKADKKAAGKVPFYKRMFGAKKKEADNPPDAAVPEISVGASGAEKGDADAQVNVGTIINLMSVDAFKVSEISGYLHFLLSSAPTQLLVCVILLYQILGLSAIPGLIVMVLLLPVNIGFAFAFGRAQKSIMAATDKRIHTTNEILQNIRIIKYFAWEKRFSKVINEKREAELKALRGKYIIWSFAVAVWNTVPVAITFFSFLVYTLVEKKALLPSVAFTAISLFGILRVPLDQLGDMIAHVNESSVSIDRVEEFLNEEETEKYEQLAHENVDEDGNEIIGFENGCFSWASKSEIVAEGAAPAFRLMDLDIKFAVGKLNIIAGPTGSGKTSLLMALLGEMSRITGKVHLPGGYSREDVRADPETGLTETVAYCAQQAWLVNANIKDNILFAQNLDEKRYHDVVVACALERDFEILDHGDKTLVGEKGITLSGGQKQRISLARALYSNSRHVLLDDCLSAVDSHTAKWIFDNCITGPLMTNRTCILVTHNLALSVPSAEHIVVMENGRIAVQGSPVRVVASGKLGEEIDLKANAPGRVSAIPSRVPSSVGDSEETLIEREQSRNSEEHGIEGVSDPPKKLKESKAAPTNPLDEEKAEGGVKYDVMMLYLRSMGPWYFWVLAVLVFGVQQFAALGANIWIREWANQYDLSEQSNPSILTAHSYLGSPASTHAITNAVGIRKFIPFFSDEYSLKNMVAPNAPEVDVKFYLIVYAVIGMGGMFVALFRDLWLFYGSLTASWVLHQKLLHNVTRAKFKFFDVTPLGQLMNRFSKDLESVDQEIAPIAVGVVGCALSILVTIGLISAITPGFLIAAVFITAIYWFLGNFYLRSSRDLKRLESVQRSPLFQQFGETLTGITTIRAYGDEKRFIRDNLLRVDTYNRPFIFLWAANRWLAFRIDVIGDLVAFFAGVLVIFSIGKIDAGSAGLSLGYAIGFTENMLWLVRLYSSYEQNMNSVERIKEYLDVEQEAAAENEKTQPAKNWPSQGSVEFINYTTRYREDLDPVLRGVTFRINPLEKVGIVGRTGAGKSSLALALFRGLEAEEGKILVDGVDIGLIGLRDLREAITIVPQDPTLFTGTIRSNLDPFSVFTDEEVFTALRRVQLIGATDTATQTPAASRPATSDGPVAKLIAQENGNGKGANKDALIDVNTSGTSTPVSTTNKNIFLNLQSPVAESGNNLSQGQRQLLCLARALLKNPKVLMMDEATASIDYSTDNKIQETIRELKSTIITIAHRLQTIVDYDKVLVLDKGEVVEFGHPHELLKKENGTFRSMCETSGELASLKKAARKAFNKDRLVDVDSGDESSKVTSKAGSSKDGSEAAEKKEKKDGKK